MNPWQLAKTSESSQQTALFCFVAKAQRYGFDLAFQRASYEAGNIDILAATGIPVPELAWFHHIPNGGSRGDTEKSAKIAGGKLKAEGVKAGVLDCFWPMSRSNQYRTGIAYCGLYIEMKRPDLKSKNNPTAGLSDEQKEFGQFVINSGYSAHVCYTWLEAAEVLRWYYRLGK
jgi:hypothetical protein